MALLNCNECNGSVSSNANHCPHCGNPISHVKNSVKDPSLNSEKRAAPSEAFDQTKKDIIIEKLIKNWGFEVALKSQWKSEFIFWFILIIFFILTALFASSFFESLAVVDEQNQGTYSNNLDEISTEELDVAEINRIKKRHTQEAQYRILNGIHTSKEILAQNIKEMRDCIKHSNSDRAQFLHIGLKAREYLIDVTYKNGLSKTAFHQIVKDDIVILSKNERIELLELIREREKDSYDHLRQLKHVNKWIIGQVNERKLDVPSYEIDELISLEKFFENQFKLESVYLESLSSLQKFMMFANYDVEDGQVLFYKGDELSDFQRLAAIHDNAMEAYGSLTPP